MMGKPFYMIAEDCFERKEFLGSIRDGELRYLADVFVQNPAFSLTKLQENLIENLQVGKEYLEQVVEDNYLIQKYRDLISYTDGAELFMIACALQMGHKNASNISLEADENYQKLEERYFEILNESEEKYERFQSSKVTR